MVNNVGYDLLNITLTANVASFLHDVVPATWLKAVVLAAHMQNLLTSKYLAQVPYMLRLYYKFTIYTRNFLTWKYLVQVLYT